MKYNKFLFKVNPESYDSEKPLVVHLSNVSNKNDLFDKLNAGFIFPYFGRNWDALYDLLRDFFWISEKRIVLVHDNLPAINSNEFNIYINILQDSISSWENYEEHDFEVIFPKECKSLIEATIESKK